MSHFDLCENDCYQNCKVIVTKNLRWYYHLTMDEKWPNYWGMAAQYWMSHQYHLAFYIWCLRWAKRPIAQFENSTYKNNSHSTRTALKRWRLLQPYFKSRKGLNQTKLHCVVTNKICRQFFFPTTHSIQEKKKNYQRATYGNAVSPRLPTLQHPLENKVTSLWELRPMRDFLQMHLLQEPEMFWFRSNGFLKRLVLLKYWLLRSFSMR